MATVAMAVPSPVLRGQGRRGGLADRPRQLQHHGDGSVLTSSLDAVWASELPLPEKRRLCARIAAAPVLAEAGKGPKPAKWPAKWAAREDQSTSEGGSTDDRVHSPTGHGDGVSMGVVMQGAEVLDAVGAINVVGQMAKAELFDLFEEQEGEALGERVAALEQSIQEQLAENSRGDDENSRRDFGKLEARLVELLAPFERMVTRVVNDVQTIHELLLESSRGDAEKSRWDVENAQSALLRLDAAAEMLQTRFSEQLGPVETQLLSIREQLAECSRSGDENSRRDCGRMETRLLEQSAPIERMLTLVVTVVQSIQEQMVESSRGDAEHSRRDCEDSQSTLLRLDAAAKKLETRFSEHFEPTELIEKDANLVDDDVFVPFVGGAEPWKIDDALASLDGPWQHVADNYTVTIYDGYVHWNQDSTSADEDPQEPTRIGVLPSGLFQMHFGEAAGGVYSGQLLNGGQTLVWGGDDVWQRIYEPGVQMTVVVETANEAPNQAPDAADPPPPGSGTASETEEDRASGKDAPEVLPETAVDAELRSKAEERENAVLQAHWAGATEAQRRAEVDRLVLLYAATSVAWIVPSGSEVKIRGVAKEPCLNGRMGQILSYDAEKSRYVVSILDSEFEGSNTSALPGRFKGRELKFIREHFLVEGEEAFISTLQEPVGRTAHAVLAEEAPVACAAAPASETHGVVSLVATGRRRRR